MKPHDAVACIALRPLPYIHPSVPDSSTTAELKRLFTLPSTRGLGLARLLLSHALCTAHQQGYTRVVLDTLPSMTAAISLYRSCGFRELDGGYYDTPREFFSIFLLVFGNGKGKVRDG
ncbi:hypothetical protein ACMFMF_010776 [Clarireedia jacksonii]